MRVRGEIALSGIGRNEQMRRRNPEKSKRLLRALAAIVVILAIVCIATAVVLFCMFPAYWLEGLILLIFSAGAVALLILILKRDKEGPGAPAMDKSKRNWWLKMLGLLVLIGISIGILFPVTNHFTEDSTKSFLSTIKEANLVFFFALIGVVLAFMLFESFQYAYLLKISTGKFRIKTSIKVAFLGKYYDYVTPLGTGGQPFQIFYLHKKDINKGVATAIPLVKYIVATFAKGAFAITLFCVAPILFKEGNSTVTTTLLIIAWISMAVNMLIPSLMLLGSLFPRAGKKLVIKIVALLAKMHIVKRKYAVTKKYVNEMGEYRRALKELLKHWWLCIPLFIICLITVFINYLIPLFVVLTLAPNAASAAPIGETLVQMLCLGIISYYSASLVPTPGNSGAMETTSALVFSTVMNSVAGAVIGWVILLWRFLTNYIYIFVGMGINIFDVIRSGVRNRRARKQANAISTGGNSHPPDSGAPPDSSE